MFNTKTSFFSRHYKLKYFLLLILTLHAFVCFSQTKHIDSLRANVLDSKNDDQKLKAVFALCDEANSLHPDTLYKYCTLANIIAKRGNKGDDIIQSNFYKAMFLSKKRAF